MLKVYIFSPSFILRFWHFHKFNFSFINLNHIPCVFPSNTLNISSPIFCASNSMHITSISVSLARLITIVSHTSNSLLASCKAKLNNTAERESLLCPRCHLKDFTDLISNKDLDHRSFHHHFYQANYFRWYSKSL